MRSTVAVAPMASASRHGPLDSKVTAAALRCPELCEPLLGRGLPGQVTCACAILVTDAGRILCQRRRQGLQCFGGGRKLDCWMSWVHGACTELFDEANFDLYAHRSAVRGVYGPFFVVQDLSHRSLRYPKT